MGTRSFIVTQNPKGDFTGIYCHWDGYPDGEQVGVGYTLQTYYKSKGKVRSLVRLGWISSLGQHLAAVGPHSFDKPQDGVTIAYGRDRGETDCKAVTYSTLKEMASHAADAWAQFIYVFDGKRWHWAPCDDAIDGKPFTTLL